MGESSEYCASGRCVVGERTEITQGMQSSITKKLYGAGNCPTRQKLVTIICPLLQKKGQGAKNDLLHVSELETEDLTT